MGIKYTYTFDQDEKGRFRDCLNRLEPEEYTMIGDIELVKPEDGRYSQLKAVIEMEPDACLTFRLGMKNVKIRRERTEEELAEEKALLERNTIKVTVIVPPGTPGVGPAVPPGTP